MQIDGTHVALRYRGTRDLPAAAVTYLYGRLVNLARTVNGPFQQSFQVQIDDRQAECRLWVDHLNGHKIDVTDFTCSDLDGFLLWRKNITGVNHWYAAFTDGTQEEILPIDEQTGDERLAGYEIPPVIQASPGNIPPVSSSLYSGQMREVVQCYYLGRDFNPFGYLADATHGLLEYPRRVIEEGADLTRGNYYIVEIGRRGVFAAPINATDRCCDSWDVTEYLAGEDETAQFRQTLSLAWNALDRAPANRPTVYTLLTTADMTPVYNYGTPFSPLAGWAFSQSGHEAQHVFQTESFTGFDIGSATPNRYNCTRIKITFTVDAQDVPSAAITVVEVNRWCTFHRPNNALWVPSGSMNGTYDGIYIHLNEIPGQDAPVHVFYVNDQECVLRYLKDTASVAAYDNLGNTNGVGDYLFNPIGLPGTFVCPGVIHGNSLCGINNKLTISAHTNRNSGFRLTGPYPYNATGLSTSPRTEARGTTSLTFVRTDVTGPFPNFAALTPADPYGVQCGAPCAGNHVQMFEHDFYSTGTFNENKQDVTSTVGSSAVLPQFEREGVVMLYSTEERLDRIDYSTVSNFYRQAVRFFNLSCTPTGLNPCCQYDNYALTECQFGGSAGAPRSWSTPSNQGVISGEFLGYALMRGKRFNAVLPFLTSNGPDGPYAQCMFWHKDFRRSVQLGLQVIGGGLYYEEEDDELAVDRMTGFIFTGDASEKGEFVYDGQPVTFVGRL